MGGVAIMCVCVSLFELFVIICYLVVIALVHCRVVCVVVVFDVVIVCLFAVVLGDAQER